MVMHYDLGESVLLIGIALAGAFLLLYLLARMESNLQEVEPPTRREPR